MAVVDPKHPLFHLLRRDSRYSLEAYLFILEALSFAQESLGLGQEPAVEELEPLPSVEPPTLESESAARGRGRPERSRKRRAERHVSGRELCEAARLYGLQQYGFLAPKVLEAWGIRTTGDFGELVFNMIDIGQMRKTRSDKREDFDDVYRFSEGFSRDLSFVVHDSAGS